MTDDHFVARLNDLAAREAPPRARPLPARWAMLLVARTTSVTLEGQRFVRVEYRFGPMDGAMWTLLLPPAGDRLVELDRAEGEGLVPWLRRHGVKDSPTEAAIRLSGEAYRRWGRRPITTPSPRAVPWELYAGGWLTTDDLWRLVGPRLDLPVIEPEEATDAQER